MAGDKIEARGPVFVSYRHPDGFKNAARMAWLLLAAGVPVWHDQSDLPPGDTNERLAQALASGLSGGILLITPDIASSHVVRTVEVPRLLDLEKDSDFVLVVGNTVRLADGSLNYGAPDDLLGLPQGTLGRLKQHGSDTRDGLVRIAREIVLHRVARTVPVDGSTGPRVLHISVQTRTVPHANDIDLADLSIRLRPAAAGRLPSRDGLKDLRKALPLLPEAVSLRAPQTVRVTGGAHLTVAFALGSALPATLVGNLVVEGTDSSTWSTGTVSTPPGAIALTRTVGHGAKAVTTTGTAKNVLAYVDLLPEPSNAAYTRLLGENPNLFDAWMHLRPSTDVPLDPSTAGVLVAEVASRLRQLSQDHDNADLHLALRVPFPVAVLLGRLLNTLRITAYEWDHAPAGDADARPRYVRALAVAPTSTDGVISAVLLPKT
jgi:hypothetical protein